MTETIILEWIEETCAAYCIPRPFAIVEALQAARATPADQEPIYQVQTGDCWLDMTREQYENHSKTRPTRILYAQAPQSDAQSVRDAWISVDERLPEPGAAVLIAFADGGVDLSFRYVMKKTGEHVCWEGVEFEHHESPTHWQPLPAPPQKPVSDEVKP